ncbi:hypothetical protein [Agrococcus jejuensis]|uniref:Uncharacterized protein n=1 Tax=Agrococcus jejuensis TaxID=399736 RepID=A0A1G8BUY4_9MICO|nr:hypothetical protein [Agrococcus jejuensis]SDH36918.1 hypothetical protein SAMN04489720_1062 [Agrococcus jejuensis]
MSDTTNRDGQVGDDDGVQPTVSAEDASTSVTDHDAHQPLVDDGDAPTQQLPTQGDAPAHATEPEAPANESDDWQRSWDEAGGGEIEPTVIAPSSLRGPSHDAEVEQSSLEQTPEAPPELVEPRRPSLSLRGEQRPDLADTAPFAGLTDPEATQAMPTTPAAEEPAPTQAQTALLPEQQGEPQFEVGEPTAVAPAVAPEQRTERLGSISVDDETARQAATGTPIVLVETPTPPRKRGARGVGFLVALLSTIVFAALLGAFMLLATYLFERDFVLADELQALWMRPAWILPVAVFFVAYWLVTLIVNRAGWWAHVLGGFIVALLAYAAHVAGSFLETQSNVWDVMGLVDITGAELGLLLVAPTSIVTFLVAREVPVWFGGIVARRGRSAKRRNKEALDEYEAEQARRLEEYEATRA